MFPIASPPAAPPPSPPNSESDVNSVRSSLSTIDYDINGDATSSSNTYSDLRPSYQKYATSRSATVPTITNYGLSPQHQFYRNSFISNNQHDNGIYSDERKSNPRGDVTLRPNTGNTNQETGAAFGSLREIASALRWMTIVTTVTAIFWEGFALPMRIVSSALLEPSKAVLGAYLGFFCLLILGVEMNAPLRDNFGFLYNPLTRGMLLLMMSSMCIGILKSWWECLLGIAFVMVGIGYIYAYTKYPEYRRWQDYNESRMTPWQDLQHYWKNSERRGGFGWRSSSGWANPDQDPPDWNIIRHTTSSSEARALLHNI
jgi:hypothetical protein